MNLKLAFQCLYVFKLIIKFVVAPEHFITIFTCRSFGNNLVKRLKGTHQSIKDAVGVVLVLNEFLSLNESLSLNLT